MTEITTKLCQWLISNDVIKEEDRAIYEFGIYQLLGYVVEYGCIFTIAIILGAFKLLLVLLLSLMILRKNAGGIHSESHLACFLVSTLTFVGVIGCVKFLSSEILLYTIIILDILSCVMIVLFAPIDTPNKPLNEKEYKVFRRRTLIALIIDLFAMIGLIVCGLSNYAMIVGCSIILSASLVVLGKIKNKLIKRG